MTRAENFSAASSSVIGGGKMGPDVALLGPTCVCRTNVWRRPWLEFVLMLRAPLLRRAEARQSPDPWRQALCPGVLFQRQAMRPPRNESPAGTERAASVRPAGNGSSPRARG